MSMSVGGGGGDEKVMSDINTTPLVDVMLVMLIIFLITVPVIVPSVKVNLPEPKNIATTANRASAVQTRRFRSALIEKHPLSGTQIALRAISDLRFGI